MIRITRVTFDNKRGNNSWYILRVYYGLGLYYIYFYNFFYVSEVGVFVILVCSLVDRFVGLLFRFRRLGRVKLGFDFKSV